MNEPVKRWITTWPLNLQPTMGSSMLDWTKVEVVPAYDLDALQARYEALEAEIARLKTPMPCTHPSSHGWGSIGSAGTSDGETWCDRCGKQLSFRRAALGEKHE